jgi:flagellar assembly factor FliW
MSRSLSGGSPVGWPGVTVNSITTVAEVDADTEGGAPVEGTSLPELSFVQPMPGFEDLQRFVLVRLDEDDDVFYELRSLERTDVRFMVAAPNAFFADYEVDLDEQACGDLALTDASDAMVLVVLNVGQDIASTTANLLAPVVVNARTRQAAQVILTGSEWPVRAPLG